MPSTVAVAKTQQERQEAGLSLGFIGCGTIAHAIATGLASATPNHSIKSIAVTKRSEKKSMSLLASFPHLVTVCSDDGDTAVNVNQDVADRSQILFLCVLPQHVGEVMSSLTLDPHRHVLVSLVSTSTLEDLVTRSNLPPDRVYKMICTASVAYQQGVCLMTPPGNVFLKELFERLGSCVECKDEDMMKAMMVPTALMGPLYGILRNNREWLIKRGVPAQDASYYLGRHYLSMIQDAERNCADPTHFDRLIAEQTPGGLNEQALTNLETQGVYDAYNVAMDATLSRLEGKTDGNISSDECS